MSFQTKFLELRYRLQVEPHGERIIQELELLSPALKSLLWEPMLEALKVNMDNHKDHEDEVDDRICELESNVSEAEQNQAQAEDDVADAEAKIEEVCGSIEETLLEITDPGLTVSELRGHIENWQENLSSHLSIARKERKERK